MGFSFQKLWGALLMATKTVLDWGEWRRDYVLDNCLAAQPGWLSLRVSFFFVVYFLKKAGFTKIESLKGGILAWGEKVEPSASAY
jgi:hypothetical protein